MAGTGYVATDTVLLGVEGEVPVGEEVPTTFTNSLGEQEKVDVERLKDLGVVEKKGRKAKPAKADESEKDGGDDGESRSTVDEPLSAAELKKLTKKELLAIAEERNVDVGKRPTNAKLVKLLKP